MPLKRYNITGKYIQRARLKEGISQQRLATILQECGFEIDTDLIYRIEAENEFVPDYLRIFFCVKCSLRVFFRQKVPQILIINGNIFYTQQNY